MAAVSDTAVFVGGYGPADQATIASFSLSGHGVLRPERAWAGVANASFVLAHPNRQHLYSVSETGLASDGAHGSVHAFRVDRDRGLIDLVALGIRSTDGDHPCHLSIDREGRWLAVSNYGSGDIAVYPINQGGDLGEMASFARHAGRGHHRKRQEGPHAHCTVFTADRRFLIAADLGIDRLVVYRFDASTGSLTPHHQVDAEPGAGPRTLAFHPDGLHLFAVNELNSTLTLLRHEPQDAGLRALQTVSTLPPDATLDNTAADLRVSASGSHVYVSNRGHNSLAVFTFHPSTGLARRATRPCGGAWPRSFTLTLDGSLLIVANQHSNEVVTLPVADGGSDLDEPIARVSVSQPSSIALV